MLTQAEIINRVISSRRSLPGLELGAPALADGRSQQLLRKSEAEGGCGVIGIACSEKIAARHLLKALEQMRNRGNGKGGGIAAVGLDAEQFGVTKEVLERDYLLTVAYLDAQARAEVERAHIEPLFEIDHLRTLPHCPEALELQVRPPEVVQYFVQVKSSAIADFMKVHALELAAGTETKLALIEDELVYQMGHRLNHAFYASTGQRRAFVLSQGKNMLVVKLVGYGDDVIRYYSLEDVRAHVWIGHHRYPTKGRVWHPGGAHPFVAVHEALVHNGDFANYSSICEYLSQRNIHPLFLTDTEVSVLLFDLLKRTYGYPLEYVIESLAPTTERDFTLLPDEKQEIYRLLQNSHMHSSPDGPWFFLIAQSEQSRPACRLIGITDTSMLRPQVFALQQGQVAVGFAASEKQAVDAALESLAEEDQRFWSRADRYWNARGGSHTDGGAFVFTVSQEPGGSARLECTDKFGKPVTTNIDTEPPSFQLSGSNPAPRLPDLSADQLFSWVKDGLSTWNYGQLQSVLDQLASSITGDADLKRAIDLLTLLMDGRYPTGSLRNSALLSLLDKGLSRVVGQIRQSSWTDFAFADADHPLPHPGETGSQIAVVDAHGFAPEGGKSLARAIVGLYQNGFRHFIVVHAKGHRFIANGLGPNSQGTVIHVYGSSGDYLGSGIDGAEVIVHGHGQDQLAQIMKSGKLVVHGDVGQTFMYSAKGGSAFVRGNAAGRPLINAVGSPRVVINGTCLDYLAESFMAGDPLANGGFVIVNGITFNDSGALVDLPEPYPGSNLFSLASGGAVYIRDPHGKVSNEQLNGGAFTQLQEADWELIKPYLEENERLFAIPCTSLLLVDGLALPPERVYRKIRPVRTSALQAEEAWVKMRA